MEKLLTARYYFTKAEHFVYCGLLENNLARLYCSESRFLEAHHFAQKADNTFKLVGDISRRGFSFNTRAMIFLAEENYEEALKFAKSGLEFLENDENLLYIVKTYKTKLTALIKLGQREKATREFEKACKIAGQLSKESLDQLKDEFNNLLRV